MWKILSIKGTNMLDIFAIIVGKNQTSFNYIFSFILIAFPSAPKFENWAYFIAPQ